MKAIVIPMYDHATDEEMREIAADIADTFQPSRGVYIVLNIDHAKKLFDIRDTIESEVAGQFFNASNRLPS